MNAHLLQKYYYNFTQKNKTKQTLFQTNPTFLSFRSKHFHQSFQGSHFFTSPLLRHPFPIELANRSLDHNDRRFHTKKEAHFNKQSLEINVSNKCLPPRGKSSCRRTSRSSMGYFWDWNHQTYGHGFRAPSCVPTVPLWLQKYSTGAESFCTSSRSVTWLRIQGRKREGKGGKQNTCVVCLFVVEIIFLRDLFVTSNWGNS